VLDGLRSPPVILRPGSVTYEQLVKYPGMQQLQVGLGNSMELLPSPSAEDVVDIEILYYANVSPLTDASPTNWLLTEHPDLYLYGALVHTAPFLKEDERVPVWEKMFVEALAEANVEDADARRSGAPMSRPRLGF